MMSSQPLFIPLYFDEVEEDLWLALQQVEPEKRSSFVKEILRRVLVTNREEPFRFPLDELSEDVQEISDDDHQLEGAHEDVLEKEGDLSGTFTLEDLFVQKDGPHSDEKPNMTNHEKLNSISGYEYMMKHIIGTEEDEAVLKVLMSGTRKKNY